MANLRETGVSQSEFPTEPAMQDLHHSREKFQYHDKPEKDLKEFDYDKTKASEEFRAPKPSEMKGRAVRLDRRGGFVSIRFLNPVVGFRRAVGLDSRPQRKAAMPNLNDGVLRLESEPSVTTHL